MTKAGALLLVNSNQRNLQLLTDFLQKEGYTLVTAQTYQQFDQMLDEQPDLAAALVDIAGFDAQIWSRCERLRATKVPFLIISPRQSAAIQQTSLSHGARGVMMKPLIIKEFVGIIHSLLEA